VNGHPTLRLANNASITFHGAEADAVMMRMKDIAVSAGSACSSARPGPSHVLRAIGLSREDAGSTLRFGLSRFTTDDEIEYAVDRIIEAVHGVRRPSFQVV
jgi:cysteine desulfurase